MSIEHKQTEKHIPSSEEIMKEMGLTEEEVIKIGKDLVKNRTECLQRAMQTCKNQVEWLTALLPTLEDDNAIPDELVTPMHNLFAMVPEEQHVFLRPIKRLFRELPEDVRLNDEEVKKIRKRLDAWKKEDLDTKVQLTDLSMYLSAYRAALYRNGVWDNAAQVDVQKHMQKVMLQIVRQTINKRNKGIKSAQFLIERS